MTKPLISGANPRHAIPGEDPQVARLSEMLVALLSELTVVSERLDTVERLLERASVMGRSDIEAFEPDIAAQGERDAKRKRMVQKVFRPLRDAAERDAAKAQKRL